LLARTICCRFKVESWEATASNQFIFFNQSSTSKENDSWFAWTAERTRRRRKKSSFSLAWGRSEAVTISSCKMSCLAADLGITYIIVHIHCNDLFVVPPFVTKYI
jgi:hypothetical protein